MEWNSLITSFIGASAGTGIVGAIIQSRFDGFVQERLEKIRAVITQETTEHQIRFSHLHEKRAEVLATAYRHLVEFQNAAAVFTAIAEYPGIGSRGERFNRLNAAHRSVQSYLPAHMIYLPEETAEKAEEFLELMWSNIHKFQRHAEPPPNLDYDKWSEAWEIITKDGKLLLHDLASDFRKLLDPKQANRP